MARRLGCALVIVLALGALPASASAFDPNVVVGGAGSKWISGDLIQQAGQNCSILGSPYTEIMVSGVSSYGGLPGVPRVGDGYWASLLVSIPGNPCGPGSASVATSLQLPRNTTIDTSRSIQCFGQLRSQTTFTENLTNQSWSFLGSSGPYCAAQASPSALHPGAWFLGFRPLASGQLFQIFVPVKSTSTLQGIGASPTDEFRWFTDSTGVYSNPGTSAVWANVFPAGSGSGDSPFIYFAGQAAIPFWKGDAQATPQDLRNRVELFANLYTAGLAGSLCYEIRRVSDNSLRARCNASGGVPGDPGWNPAVPAGLSLAQVLPDPLVKGPNGGYAFWAFDPPGPPTGEWDTDMKIMWTFSYNDGSPKSVSKEATFHTLAGPDDDGDGVPNLTDLCPAAKGTLANGCLPAVQPDPDHDGVYGAADLCPNTAGQGTLNGCPGGVVPKPDADGDGVPDASDACPSVKGTLPNGCPPAVRLAARLAVRAGTKFKRKAITKGTRVRFTCTRDSAARATLSITRKTAKSLRIKTTKRTLVLATAKGTCKAKGGGSLTLKVARTYVPAVQKAKKAFAASLALRLTAAGQPPATATAAVRIA